jgi:hypothetical protein
MPGTGLPDFSGYNIPKRGEICQMTTKYTKWPQNIPNVHYLSVPNGCKIGQMAIKYATIVHCKTLLKLPKFCFWFENVCLYLTISRSLSTSVEACTRHLLSATLIARHKSTLLRVLRLNIKIQNAESQNVEKHRKCWIHVTRPNRSSRGEVIASVSNFRLG